MSMLTVADAEHLRGWMTMTFNEMVSCGFVVPPWTPPGTMYDILVSYYRVALTPEEAAEAIFATKH